ncbi:TetR/AcrR family transcriptional regulator [Sphingosinithalassobacter portus]|uniref:TetR/AcrR family transcriptional regulator n=1 Tax=Stakelama portus TaxID=2676234 RepID=UPI0013796568|nr:TetR/AcrR family transcriptional regulator [Sphingosinithalassobacter portus]
MAAACDVFAANGYAGARLEDVAVRVGISKSALYLQFADKQALFRELIDWLLETSLPGAVPAESETARASERLAIFVRAGARRLAQGEIAFLPRLVIGESGNFPEIAKTWHDVAVSRLLTLVEAIVDQGIADGEFRQVDAHLAARSVAGALILGALWNTVFVPVGAPSLDLGALADTHIDILLHGLSRGGEA